MLKISKILCPTDFSDCAIEATRQAIQLANQFDAETHLLHAIVLHSGPFYPDFPDTEAIYQAFQEHSENRMDALVESLDFDPVRTKRVQLRGEAAGPVILEYAAKEGIDLIVMATHGRRGLRHLFLGSVAEEVVRHAPCPVLTLRQGDGQAHAAGFKQILVPVDFSDHSKQAVSRAKELAAIFNAELQLLHVIPQPVYPLFYEAISSRDVYYNSIQLEEESRRALEDLFRKAPGPNVPATFHIAKGVVTEEILDFAQRRSNDLVVIATHGLTGLSHLLVGSVCATVLGRAPCPVMAVRPLAGEAAATEAA